MTCINTTIANFVKVFKIAYCDYYHPSLFSEWSGVCREFVEAVSHYQPEMLKKQKVHLLLHLAECVVQFGPTSAFNSERYGLIMIGKTITINKQNVS